MLQPQTSKSLIGIVCGRPTESGTSVKLKEETTEFSEYETYLVLPSPTNLNEMFGIPHQQSCQVCRGLVVSYLIQVVVVLLRTGL